MDKVQEYRERRMRRLLERFDGGEREEALNKVDAYRERRRKRLAARGSAEIQSGNSRKRLTEGSEYGKIKSSGEEEREDSKSLFIKFVYAKAGSMGHDTTGEEPEEVIAWLKENGADAAALYEEHLESLKKKDREQSLRNETNDRNREENLKYGGREKKKKAVAEQEKEARKKERQVNTEARLVQNVGTRSHPASLGANPDFRPFDPANLQNHWDGGKDMHGHKAEALKLGLRNKEEYGAFALALIKCPCKKNAGSFRKSDGKTVQFDVDGFMRDDKSIVRYDNTTGWIVFGNPEKGITSCYPVSREYFDKEKRERWDRNYQF